MANMDTTLQWLQGRVFLSSFLKEALHQLFAFVGKDACGYCCFWMKGIGGMILVAAFFVGCANNYAGQLSPADGTCTHYTWFYGYI